MTDETDHVSMDNAKSPGPGSVEWLRPRIQEHRNAQAQAQAQANAHDGAAQALQGLLDALTASK